MKKRVLMFVYIVMLSVPLMAQIPNAGFENWTNGNPDGWFANNIPPLTSTVTKTTTVHSGSAALKGQVMQFYTAPMSPIIQSGVDARGFPVSERYAKVSGYYQLNSVEGDQLGLNFVLLKHESPVAQAAALLGPASSYTQFNLDFTYFSSDVPDTCILQFLIAPANDKDTIHLGSYYLLDDLSLSGIATSVASSKKLTEYELEQNYPNPFNPATKISYTIPKNGFVSLKVYDILGNLVSTLVNEEKPAGQYSANFSAANLPSGFYIYQLKSGSYSMTRKMLLLK